jgi:hypothetical protein
MRWRFLLDWRKLLIYSHRWLGIAGCLLFVSWFASGIVMMYQRMPRITAEERLMRLPALDASRITISVAETISRHDLKPERVRIGMIGNRPVYRFLTGANWTTVFADTGEKLASVNAEQAMALARGLAPENAGTLHYSAALADSDQWTLSSVIRAQMPMHRIDLGDAAGSTFYISERTGDVAMKSTSKERFWGYLGGVLHYIYFTPFRRQADFWNSSIIWLSFFGCLSCISGVAAGIWRFSRRARFRHKDGTSHSPYVGMMLWHHYAGLIFGLFSFTWILSGGLSLNPMKWSPGTSATAKQRERFAGGSMAWKDLTAERIRSAVRSTGKAFVAKELEVIQFAGEPFFVAYRPPPAAESPHWTNTDLSAYLSPTLPLEHYMTAVRNPGQPVAGFSDAQVLDAARKTMPGVAVTEAVRLTDYDSYYYDRFRAKPLPVWRVRFADPQETWLYVDASRGLIAQKQERLSRWNRWLYRGLHSLDFPFLYKRRPLWDIVVIILSLGGILLSALVLIPSWKRVRRHVRRMTQPAFSHARSQPAAAPANAMARRTRVKTTA